MAVIVTRITNPTGGTAKGSPLTSVEIDANFNNLNNAKAEYPSQTGNANKYLLTNGSTASWSFVGQSATVVTNANLTGMVTSVGNAATVVTNANLTGDVTSTGNATTVVKINGTTLSGLATGILKNTTSTGVPSIAVAGDFPTLNQNTTGSAASLSATLATGSGGTGAGTLALASIVTYTGSETLTNKTLTSPIISTIINGAATLTLPTSTGTISTVGVANALSIIFGY